LKPTSRGWKLIAVSILLLASSILFSDPLMLASFLLLAILMVAALADLRRKVAKAKEIKVEPSELRIKVKAGDEGKLFFKLYSKAPMELEASESWMNFQPETVEPPEAIITASIKPMLSGIYELTKLKARISDFLNLFQASGEAPIRLRIEAYPRVLPWILEALRLIGEAAVGFGDLPGKRKGRGLEYFWSREYQIGDDISSVDWKATARHQKIIVKEFLEETSGTVKIVYDIRAHGPITKDECSAYFLSSVISASQAERPISIVIKSGDEVILDRENMNSMEALKLALAYVVKSYESSEWSIYELVEPKSARALMRISREIGSEAFREVAELKLSELLRRLRRILESAGGFVIYVGCVLTDSSFVKDLVEEIADIGGRSIILTPPKPWLDAKNLEEAYLMHQSHGKLLRALERMGARLRLTSFPSL